MEEKQLYDNKFYEKLGGLIVHVKKRKAVNWNKLMDEFTQVFWRQNVKQMWTDTEYVPSKDKPVWNNLPASWREVYKHVLGGLTLLDTQQANLGMPKIAEATSDLQRKAVLSFQAMMENIHAKSYSTIFTTLIESDNEIEDVFSWVDEEKHLQYKANRISVYYEDLDTHDMDSLDGKKALYKAMFASVLLESFLFYSGFFFPLWLAGQGKLIASGEIINKIIADESVHGSYIGVLAQELYEEFDKETQKELDEEMNALLDDLLENEYEYTEMLYGGIGLSAKVKSFVRYNANKALMSLGKEPRFEDDDVDAIVLNGLSVETKTHDFFSTKNTGYIKAEHRDLVDADFDFPNRDDEFLYTVFSKNPELTK